MKNSKLKIFLIIFAVILLLFVLLYYFYSNNLIFKKEIQRKETIEIKKEAPAIDSNDIIIKAEDLINTETITKDLNDKIMPKKSTLFNKD